VLPSNRIILQGYYGDTVRNKVTITSLDEQPLEITQITSTMDDTIKYKLETIEKGKVYSLEIMTSSGMKKSFLGYVLLKTNNQKVPEFKIMVTGKVNKKEIKVAPEYLYFGIIDAGKDIMDPNSLERTIMVSSMRDNNGLTIEKIEPSANWITAEAVTNKQGEKYTIIIKLDKNKLQKGDFKEKIAIYAKTKYLSEVTKVMIEGKVL
jgi:hypothetical protein